MIERRDGAVLDSLPTLRNELDDIAQDWASSADVDTQELAKELKDVLDASEELD
jgi:hypothetical protein